MTKNRVAVWLKQIALLPMHYSRRLIAIVA